MGKGHGNSIERKGAADAMDGFDIATGMDAKYYQLWQGSTLKITYDGDDITGVGRDMLDNMLQAAASGGSKATYSLRFFTKLGKGETIDSNTPYMSSFNFKLNDDSTLYPGIINQGAAGIGTTGRPSAADNLILQKLTEMEKRLQDIEETGAVGEVDEDPLDKYAKIMQIPVVERALMGAINFFTKHANSMSGPNNRRRPAGGGLAGVEDTRNETEKCQEAIERLAKIDPELGTHLLLLAQVAEQDIDVYEVAINKLKKYAR